MENIMINKLTKFLTRDENKVESSKHVVNNLAEAEMNTEYTIKDIATEDEELKKFLFTLGCYEGESITVISVLAENYVINVKDARYSIDKNLAEAIIV